jgi:protein-tyrosine-phosphatase
MEFGDPNIIDTELPEAILFSCTMNAVRSPMAEALAKHFLGTRVFIDSAGVRAGELDGFAVEVLNEIGVDLSRHNPKMLDDLWDSSFDLIVSLTPEAQHKAVELTRTMACDVEYWPTFDPTLETGSREQRLLAYRQVRDILIMKIKKRFPELIAA